MAWLKLNDTRRPTFGIKAREKRGFRQRMQQITAVETSWLDRIARSRDEVELRQTRFDLCSNLTATVTAFVRWISLTFFCNFSRGNCGLGNGTEMPKDKRMRTGNSWSRKKRILALTMQRKLSYFGHIVRKKWKLSWKELIQRYNFWNKSPW